METPITRRTFHDRFCELLTATDFELLSGMMCRCEQRAGRQQTTQRPLPPLPKKSHKP